MGEGTGAGLTARSRGDTPGQEKITDVPQHKHTLNCTTDDGVGLTDDPAGAILSKTDGANVYNDPGVQDDTMDAISIENTGEASGVDVMNPASVVKFLIKT